MLSSGCVTVRAFASGRIHHISSYFINTFHAYADKGTRTHAHHGFPLVQKGTVSEPTSVRASQSKLIALIVSALTPCPTCQRSIVFPVKDYFCDGFNRNMMAYLQPQSFLWVAPIANRGVAKKRQLFVSLKKKQTHKLIF